MEEGSLFFDLEADTGTMKFDTEDVVFGERQPGSDPANTTYIIDNQEITLTDGKYEEEIPETSSKIVTTLWSTTPGDLNGDGVDDAGIILVQQTEGSGSFYYAAASMNRDGEWFGTNADLLGDRVAPQTTAIEEGVYIVNYAERAPGEPMSAPPSVGTSNRYVVENGVLKELSEQI